MAEPTNAIASVQERATPGPEFPRVYRLDMGRQLLMVYVFVVFALVAGMILFAVVVRPLPSPPPTFASMAVASLFVLLSAAGMYLSVRALRSKLVLQEDAITLFGPFDTCSIHKKDIAGRRIMFGYKRFRTLVLEPVRGRGRPLKIPCTIDTDAAFDAWLNDIPVLP